MTINWEVIIWTCITLAVLMSVIGLILYAISAKNVRSKRKELGEVHTELKVGSRIMFAGGVYGKVVGIDDEDTLRVEVAPSACTLTGRAPAVWAASTTSVRPCFFAKAETNARSVRSPVTLEACVTTTRRVFGRRDFSNCSYRSRPVSSTSTTLTSAPCSRRR